MVSGASGERIAVIGLGYVGLPVALAFAKAFPGTVGFDIDRARVDALSAGDDHTGECDAAMLHAAPILFTAAPRDLADASVYVVAVPTPIDANSQPDLAAVRSACCTVGAVLSPGDVVVFESTVYPGVTEEVCGPILAEVSGLQAGLDFHLGYSPERINPGDREHTIDRIVKVVAGDDAATLERLARVYGAIVPAGIHQAPSIKVAEAAKVIENTQRDLNIALMNELALIFDRLGIRTQDVLEAAGTKWNFLPFKPGLVGGHCIGVDPYYLTAKAESVGYHPEVILAGRRINDGMGCFVAQRLVKLLAAQGRALNGARVGVLGLTFKENVADLRNSQVPNIVRELREFGIFPLAHDPVANPQAAAALFGLTLSDIGDFRDLDGLVLAVPHQAYRVLPIAEIVAMLRPDGIVMDVKSVLNPDSLPPGISYWSL
jgi:UDP-N-acetyl-D-galactosamine dehydrogenase